MITTSTRYKVWEYIKWRMIARKHPVSCKSTQPKKHSRQNSRHCTQHGLHSSEPPPPTCTDASPMHLHASLFSAWEASLQCALRPATMPMSACWCHSRLIVARQVAEGTMQAHRQGPGLSKYTHLGEACHDGLMDACCTCHFIHLLICGRQLAIAAAATQVRLGS